MGTELHLLKASQPLDLPCYRKVEVYLRSLIAEKTYPLGSKLPSELKLAQQFRVSRITIRRAMLQLQFDGLVQRRPGRGTIIAGATIVHTPGVDQSVDDEALSRGFTTGYRLVSYRAVEPEGAVSGHLRSSDSIVFLLKRVKLIAGQPIAVETRFFPDHIGAKLSVIDVGSFPLFTLLMRAVGKRPVRISEIYSSCTAGRGEAALLDVPPRFPLFVKEHTIFDKDDMPLEYGKTVFRSDRYRVSVEFR
jgi:GntR family transcriptional regulator